MLLSLPSFRRLLLRSRSVGKQDDSAILMDQISNAHAHWLITHQRVVDLSGEQADSKALRAAEAQREKASDQYKRLVAQLMQKAPCACLRRSSPGQILYNAFWLYNAEPGWFVRFYGSRACPVEGPSNAL